MGGFRPVVTKTDAKIAAVKEAKKELDGQSGVQLGMTVKKEQAVFGEWYAQVRVVGISERGGTDEGCRCSSRERCSTTTISRGATSSSLGRTVSGRKSRVRLALPSFASVDRKSVV